MRSGKFLSPALLALGLAACGAGTSPRLPPLPDLPSFEVTAPTALSGRGWDGVVEAVRRADLSAQTAGRVATMAVDVNDRVAAGELLLRITAVEQDAAANTARAQLRAADAAAAEAELNLRRYAALAEKQFVSPAQIDQARAARDTAVAARDAARAQLAQAEQQAGYTLVKAPFDGIVSARAVEPGEPRYRDTYDIGQVQPELLEEIKHFFDVYKMLQPEGFVKTGEFEGPDAAWAEIEACRARFPGPGH